MKKTIALSLSLLLLIAAITGCNRKSPSTPTLEPQETGSAQNTQEPTPKTIMFTDSCGRTVELPAEITRVAPSGQVAQMMLYAVKPECLVGLSIKTGENARKYLPESFTSLPVFGQFYGKNASLNMEALVAANPQVIIDIGDMKPTHKEDMDALMEQTGIPTIFINSTIADMPQAFRTLGALLKCGDTAEAQAKYIEDTINEAAQKANGIPEADRKTVYYGTGEDGLQANASGSMHALVIDAVGAKNALVVEEVNQKGGGNVINMETLMQLDPDFIVLHKNGPFADAKTADGWKTLTAVKTDKYYEVPAEPYGWLADPPSINRIIGIKWLGSLVYPEIFDYDIAEEAKEFFRLIYRYELTDEEISALLTNSVPR